jgi:hypothetical protein
MVNAGCVLPHTTLYLDASLVILRSADGERRIASLGPQQVLIGSQPVLASARQNCA